MRRYFITATGTDIGKTFLTCLLAQQLRHTGYSVHALKPIISGFTTEGSDTHAILHSLGLPCDAAHIEAISPWRFTAPLSPDMAAAREGHEILFADVLRFAATPSQTDVTLIEGAGGVMTPLTQDKTMLDLAKALNIHTILVAGSYLGTLSHTLTALAALAAANVPVTMVAVSETAGSTVSLDDTVSSLSHFTPLPIIALPRLEVGKTPLNIGTMLSMITGS